MDDDAVAKRMAALAARLGGGDGGHEMSFDAPSTASSAPAQPRGGGGGERAPQRRAALASAPPAAPAVGGGQTRRTMEEVEEDDDEDSDGNSGPVIGRSSRRGGVSLGVLRGQESSDGPGQDHDDDDGGGDDGDDDADLLEDPFLASSNAAIAIRMVRTREDLEASEGGHVFHPALTHQFFGDRERIYGYKNLRVTLNVAASSLTMWSELKHSGIVTLAESDGVPPDDVLGTLAKERGEAEWDTGAWAASEDAFAASLTAPPSLVPFPPGAKLSEIMRSDTVYEIYTGVLAENPQLATMHARAQIFVKLFIDAASYIDSTDPRWSVFFMWEKLSKDTARDGPSHAFVAYCTVYRYYVYPDKARLRVSQVVVLPPYQKRGLGAALLQSVYEVALADSDVVEVNVEVPNEDFTLVRDVTDVRNVLKAGFFGSEAALVWSSELCSAVQSKLKINKAQVRRVYEILRLRGVKGHASATDALRLEIKQRLYKEHQEDLGVLEEDDRKKELAKLYDQLVQAYTTVAVIARLN